MATMQIRHRGARAFSFVEILVVITIIALLIALAMPLASAVRDQARAAQCTSQLHQLGVAYGVRAVDMKPAGQPAIADAASWPQTLLPYVNNLSQIYYCPSAGEAASTSSTSMVDGISIRISDSGAGSIDVPLGDTSPLLWRIGWQGPGPQTTGAYSLGTLRWLELRQFFTVPGYKPPTDPAYLNNPENMFSISPKGDGTVTINTIKATHYVQFYQLLVGGVVQKDQNGQIYMYGGSTYKLGTSVPDYFGYGMNNRVSDFDGGQGRRILMMDYRKVVADQGDAPGQSPPYVHMDSWPLYRAPRHRGQMNVLYTDGSVVRQAPDEVDPAIPTNQKSLWQPGTN